MCIITFAVMIHIGQINTLEIFRETPQGLYLVDAENNSVLLPNRYVPENFKIWDKLQVFVYLDNEERPVATTQIPHITRGEFAVLRCSEVNDFGAFLDWGLVKQLFCPFKEQAFKMKPKEWYLVHCFLDEKSQRLVASSKTNQFLSNKELTVKAFEEVDLIVSHPSDIGMNVIVNKTHIGLIYKDQIYTELSVGDKLKGIVKKIREGNKLDITLNQIGYRSIEPNANNILEHLKSNKGFLKLTDNSSPEEIKEQLQMSKKSFKKAVGILYKDKKINLTPEGIYLN